MDGSSSVFIVMPIVIMASLAFLTVIPSAPPVIRRGLQDAEVAVISPATPGN